MYPELKKYFLYKKKKQAIASDCLLLFFMYDTSFSCAGGETVICLYSLATKTPFTYGTVHRYESI
ncbi:hypothetical protein CN326_04975 [Bacillus sp. AFS018417]|nr:hypothetical protein CN326_04975 [Bacillus sp. AFS018417]